MSETVHPLDVTDSVNVTAEGDDVRVDLYDANKGKTPRTGGPYLDEIEAEEAEKRRAKVEGREPDLENPGPYVGTRLVPKSQLTERDTDKSHYSDAVEVKNEPVTSFVAEKPVNEPDPTQVDWDNDGSKVAALEAKVKLQELADRNNTPDPEPSVADHFNEL